VKRKLLKEGRSKESGRIKGGEANLAKKRSGSVQKKTKQEMKKKKTSFSVNKTYRNKFKNRAPAISIQLKACIWYGCHDNKIESL
jgi:hypothetical protein